MRQIAVFGEQLSLHRRIDVTVGSDELGISDTVTNIGFTETSHMMLYHCNVGFPVVDEDAELIYPAATGTCVSEACDTGSLAPPRRGFVEECYEHPMQPDEDGFVTAAVVNWRAGLGVVQRYDHTVLPHHITWRQLGEGTYVLAMEPSTNRDAGRFDARARDELQILVPSEQRHYRQQIGAVVGDAIEALAHEASAICAVSV